MFQLSAALHDVSPAYWASANTQCFDYRRRRQSDRNRVSGHPDSKWGGAVRAALQIKNIPTGPGDDIKVQGSWGVGATKYILGTAAALPGSFYMTKGNASTTAGTIAIGAITDGVMAVDTPLQAGVQLTQGWGFRGAFNHNWDPYWSSSLFGGIAQISYNDTAKALWCASYGGTPRTVVPSRAELQHPLAIPPIGLPAFAIPAIPASPWPRSVSSPAGLRQEPDLQRGNDVLLPEDQHDRFRLRYHQLGVPGCGRQAGWRGGATWQDGNVGTISFNLRAQRNF